MDKSLLTKIKGDSVLGYGSLYLDKDESWEKVTEQIDCFKQIPNVKFILFDVTCFKKQSKEAECTLKAVHDLLKLEFPDIEVMAFLNYLPIGDERKGMRVAAALAGKEEYKEESIKLLKDGCDLLTAIGEKETPRELLEIRKKSLRKIVDSRCPEIKRMVNSFNQKRIDCVCFHQDAFAADYQDHEYKLLGMVIKYIGMAGAVVTIIGKNGETIGDGR